MNKKKIITLLFFFLFITAYIVTEVLTAFSLGVLLEFYFKKIMYIYVSIFLLTYLLIFFFGVKKTEDYLLCLKKGSSYSIFDFHSDYLFNKKVFKRLISKFSSFCLFNLVFVFVLVGRPLLIPSVLLFYVYYLYNIYYFKNSRDYHPIRLYKEHFHFTNCPNYRSCIYLFFVTIPQKIGFVLAYFSWKFIYNKSFPKYNYKDLFACFALIFILGISIWSIYVTLEITEDLLPLLKKKYFIKYYFPRIIFYNFTSKFNKFAVIAEELKIYKLNNKLTFNPQKKIPCAFTSDRVVKLKSPIFSTTNKLKYITHPGINLGSKNFNDSNGHNMHVLITGKPTREANFIKFNVSNYKAPLNYHCTNFVRPNSLSEPYFNENIIHGLGLNESNYMHYVSLINAQRLLLYGTSVCWEFEEKFEIFKNENNFFNFIIKEENAKRLLIDEETKRYTETILDRFEKIPFNDKKDMIKMYKESSDLVHDFHDKTYKPSWYLDCIERNCLKGWDENFPN